MHGVTTPIILERSPSWSTACLDWEDRIRGGRSLLPDLPLFRADADKAVKIFDMLQLPDVPGLPTMAEAAGPWMRDTVAAIFGSWDPVAGVRHIREFFELVPKKNAKTTGGAAIMLTATLMSKRPRGEFLIVAPTQEVSEIAFSQACGMVRISPTLSRLCHIQDHIKKITYRPTGAFLKVKSFDPKIVTGSKPAGVLLDELHVIAEHHNADRVIGQLRGGMVSQPEAFLLMITTQSERTPAGVFRAELAKARAVRDGRLEAPILPLLYEFPKGTDWREPKNWPMVLPNNGRSITAERLLPDYVQAEAAGIEEMIRWASQHLNVEIGVALLFDAWGGAEYWQRQGGELTLDELLDRCDVVEVGIDGGGLNDLLGLAVMGRDAESGDWLHWGHAWCHPIALERRKENAPRYRDFDDDGDMTIVDEIGQDVTEVADLCARIYENGKLDRIGVDPVGISAIVDAIVAREIPADLIVGIPQGYKLQGAIKTVERKLAEGTLWHGGSALMAWSVGNAKVEQRGNAIVITKQTAGLAKIDPLVALFNAAALLSLNATPRLPVQDWIG